ncbi:MAG TPA: zinc ribbon domain-containing protein [Spongiibacteraceae bacterium]
MPIYEYQCEACQHELEALQKLSDAPLLQCPQCSALKLRKKVSAAGFRLKGGGWYETDFKSAGKKNVAGEKDNASTADSTGKSADANKSGGESTAATPAAATSTAPNSGS